MRDNAQNEQKKNKRTGVKTNHFFFWNQILVLKQISRKKNHRRKRRREFPKESSSRTRDMHLRRRRRRKRQWWRVMMMTMKPLKIFVLSPRREKRKISGLLVKFRMRRRRPTRLLMMMMMMMPSSFVFVVVCVVVGVLVEDELLDRFLLFLGSRVIRITDRSDFRIRVTKQTTRSNDKNHRSRDKCGIEHTNVRAGASTIGDF